MKIKEITLKENYKVTQNSPQGLELTAQDGTKMILPPDKIPAVQASQDDPNKFTLNPQAMATPDGTQQQQQQPIGPQIGAEVEMPADIQTTEDQAESELMNAGISHIGGDAGDDFVNDITQSHNRMQRTPDTAVLGNHSMRESAELNAMLTIAGLR